MKKMATLLTEAIFSCFEPGESRLSPSFLSWASEPPLLDCTPSDPSLRATKRAPTSVLAEKKREEKKERKAAFLPLLLSFCRGGIVEQGTPTILVNKGKNCLCHVFAFFEKRKIDFSSGVEIASS